MNYDILESILNGGSDPTNLPLQFLSYITKNFSKERKIGSGGFGEVYMVILTFRYTGPSNCLTVSYKFHN